MEKRTYALFIVVLSMVGFYLFSTVDTAYAAEGEKSGNKVVQFFKNLINWPFSITKKTSEAVGRTTKRATTMVTTTGSSSVEMVTGKPEKMKDVIVEPVKGSGETAYTAVEGIVKAPIEGTEEAFKK